MAKQATLNARFDSCYSTLDGFARQYATHNGAGSGEGGDEPLAPSVATSTS